MDLEKGQSGASVPLVMDTIHGTSFAREQYSKFLDRCFRLPQGNHYLDDFPVWDSRNASQTEHLNFGVFSQGELIATTAVRMAELHGKAGAIPVALIGAVATDEKWRGRGLASQLVSFAVQWAQERNAAMALLWGSEQSMYLRLGFGLCGQQVRKPISELSGSSSNIQISEGWIPAIFSEFLQKRSSGLKHNASDMSWLAAHKNVKWFWLGSPDKPLAYAAYERGVDLQGMIHEWGGDKNALMRLFEGLHAKFPQASILGSPERLDELGIPYDANSVEFLCMSRIINPQKIFSAYHPGVALEAERSAVGWKISIGEKSSPIVLSDEELTRAIFGPQIANETVYWPQYLPLPLWIWGLDAA